MIRELVKTLQALRPTAGELRWFGGILALVVTLLTWRSGLPTAFFVAPAALLTLAFATPRLLWPIYFTMMALALPIGWLVSRILLTILFCVLVVPTRLLLSLTGSDPLKLRRSRAPSYWEPIEQNTHLTGMGY